MSLRLNVNRTDVTVTSDPSTPLLYVLRNELGLTGAKFGCGLEQCGACAVLVDGVASYTCAAPVAGFEGREIVTVEGLAGEARSPLQEAFIAERAAQCGYCTAGMLIAATALLRSQPQASEEDVRAALTAHLCRCGAHPRVLRAVCRVLAAPS